MTIQLFHNVRCSKSRAALELLSQKEIDFETINYLETPLDRAMITQLLKALNFESARQMMRRNEEVYKELELSEVTTESELIDAMIKHPILIERPIIYDLAKNRAVIGRPTENILTLL